MPKEDIPTPQTLESSTYDILQNRLQQGAALLREKLNGLNQARKEVFGSIETALKATERIHTSNNCVPYDMVPVGDQFIFGYNVHLGLKTQVELSDVFSVYAYQDHTFHELGYDFIQDAVFVSDFQKLYKYYKDAKFIRFVLSEPYLYMVFQISKGAGDIKAFKWEIDKEKLLYLDNRSEHELTPPPQHDFSWQRTTRDYHRSGKYPHISVQDQVFVETLNGDLTIKVEDNTDTGQGIYCEAVEDKDQTLDDAEVYYALLENIILLKIRPYQEKHYRYIAYNAKLQQARRIDALADAAILLPNQQGILFPNGYYLQTGEFKAFDEVLSGLRFEKKIASPNGEDFLYIFYHQPTGVYQLLLYNIIEQTVRTPIVCHGYAIFGNGELCYFNAEAAPQKHHAIRIWQTPFVDADHAIATQSDSYLYKVGNKDIVRAMAECQALITLIEKGENYQNVYVDLQKQATTLLDAYYWLSQPNAFALSEPIQTIREASAAAIDEFEKVRHIRENTQQQVLQVTQAADRLTGDLKKRRLEHINEFVEALSALRRLRGEVISLKSLRYVAEDTVAQYEALLQEHTDKTSANCVRFLLQEAALAPYHQQVDTLEKTAAGVKKVVDAETLEKEIQQFSSGLEMLMEVVSNLKIEDATQTTRIIDRMAAIFAELNKVKALLKRKRKELLSLEGKAEFYAQTQLINQALVNYLDVAGTPEKCDEYLNKLMVQLEELEGKFAEFEEFTTQLMQLREEIYNAFESRKVQLIEALNKRASALMQSADRVLKAVQNRMKSLSSVPELNGYFASDLMIEKLRSIVAELQKLGDSVKADALQSRLKSLREDAARQIKDRTELYAGGGNMIRFGNHLFSVNTADLALTTVLKDDQLFYHLTGTNFYEAVAHEKITAYRPFWDQVLPSENEEVYRSEYLAYQMFVTQHHLLLNAGKEQPENTHEKLLPLVQQYMATRYEEGYVKGVHDQDAALILQVLLTMYQSAGLLRYPSDARTCAALFWLHYLDKDRKALLNHQLKGAGLILQVFPQSDEFAPVRQALMEEMERFITQTQLFETKVSHTASEYLFYELISDDDFVIDQSAVTLKDQFLKHLERNKASAAYKQSVASLQENAYLQYDLIRKWIRSYVRQSAYGEEFEHEAAFLLFSDQLHTEQITSASLQETVTGLQGSHPVIREGSYTLHYHRFISKLQHYGQSVVPAFTAFQSLKRTLTHAFTEELRLHEFKPKVMNSFVRNRLIDKVYFPLIGANLAKQIGTAGENKRTDLMGMLLLISPPGYGKTTLMEYLANRLGIVFMKINGPAIGHAVTALDPAQAPNAGAREELEKLNLAFEMGDNVMIYVDDIQHCHPEFLQKFISLCDAQRKVEGVYKGKSKTYDFRGKKVCVVMAGNPYTESGEKFKIPDMLTNRADIYNLGDIIGGTVEEFKLSYLENCLTSNPVLNKLANKSQQDTYTLIKIAATGEQEGMSFEANHAAEEVREYVAVFQKLLTIRDVVLQVNMAYIHSAAQADSYRTEPPFKLQGSYRDMNKLAEKIVPIMNEQELQTLIFSHYENEAQTLTSGAEANMLKFKEMMNVLSEKEAQRWQDIKAVFVKQQQSNGSNGIGAQMEEISNSLKGIASWLTEAGNRK